MFQTGNRVRVRDTADRVERRGQVGVIEFCDTEEFAIVVFTSKEDSDDFPCDHLELVVEPAMTSTPALDGAGDRLGWLTDDQVQVVSSWYSTDSWRQNIGEWLDGAWGTGWEESAVQDKRTLLQEMINHTVTMSETQSNTTASNAADSGTVTNNDNDRFAWMLPEQVTRVVAEYGTSWRTKVSQWLDDAWGTGWEHIYTAQDKATSFTGLLDHYHVGIQSEPKDVEVQATGAVSDEVKPQGDLKRRASGEQPDAPKAKDPRTAQRSAIRAAITTLRTQGKRDHTIYNRADLVEYLSAMVDVADRNAVIAVYNAEIANDDEKGPITAADLAAAPAAQPAAADWSTYWSAGKAGNRYANGEEHYAKHGNEHHFAYASIDEYTAAAVEFRQRNSHNAQYESGNENNSIICRYSLRTARGTYLVMDANNKIVSFYALANCSESYLREKVRDLTVVYTD